MTTRRTAHSSADVSAIITVFDNAPTIGEAIESVLSQTRPPSEVIVVDDGSGDGSGDVARSFGPPVRVIRQDNRGISAARNRGVAASRRPLLASIDADDRWAPDKLERQLELLTGDVDAVSCLVAQVPQAEWTVTVHDGLPPKSVMRGPLWSTLLLRRSAFDRTGDFDPAYRMGEQIEWWARAKDAGLRVITVEQPLVYRRLHDQNHGIRQHSQRADYARAIHAVLQRRRAAAAAAATAAEGDTEP